MLHFLLSAFLVLSDCYSILPMPCVRACVAQPRIMQPLLVGYTRGPSVSGAADDAEVDVGRIESLIGKRAELRAKKDFAAADALQDELRAMGITLKDKQQQWVTDGPNKKRPSPGSNWRRKRRGTRDKQNTATKSASGAVSCGAESKASEAVVKVVEATMEAADEMEDDDDDDSLPKTPRELMLELQEELEVGMISQDEFAEKRKAIIAEVVYQYPISPSDFGYYTAAGSREMLR